jgi:hypothetical protein
VKTARRGRATLRIRLHHRGKRTAFVSHPGLLRTTLLVRVLPARRR